MVAQDDSLGHISLSNLLHQSNIAIAVVPNEQHHVRLQKLQRGYIVHWVVLVVNIPQHSNTDLLLT